MATTYYVHKGTGTDGPSVSGDTSNPWASISYSLGRMAAGDTLKVRAGVTPYYESVTVSLAGITIEADTGHSPIIDGKYDPSEGYFKPNGDFVVPSGQYPPDGNDWVFEGENTAQMLINAQNVTIRNLIFRYSPGRCLTFNKNATGANASGSTAVGCIFDYAYDACVVINSNSGFIDNVLVDSCFILRSSMRKFDPLSNSGGPDSVATTYKPVRGRDCTLRDTVIAYCGGEGASAAKGSRNTTIEGCVIYDCYHWHLGNQRGQGATLRNNFVFHTGRKAFLQKDKAGNLQLPDGLVIGDEGSSESFGPGNTPSIYNNIFVNFKFCFWLRAGGNYKTRMNGAYLGYNTFVWLEDPQATKAIKIEPGLYGAHYNNLFENNIVYAPSGKIFDGSSTGFSFRNNAYRALPPSAIRGDNDQIESAANPIAMVNPTKIPESTFTFSLDMTSPALITAMPTLTQLRAMAERYRIADSGTACIGKASDGSPVSAGGYTITPPTTPQDEDFWEADRDANPDIGAHENGGNVTPGDDLDASFSATPTSGQAPLAVTFTNTTSLSGSASDNAWAWDFGDGNTSTLENPTNTYAIAGTYVVTFTASDTVLGLSDSATTTITVSAAPPPGEGADVAIRQTRVALNTSLGTQSITIADWVTDSITPQAVEVIVTAATADGTAADGELLSIGYGASGSGQVVCCVASDHGVADVNAARRWTDDAIILTINGSGLQTGRATIQSWDAGGITLNITDAFPSAYLATVVFRAGTEYRAWAGTAPLGNVNTSTTVNAGFTPDAAQFAATWGSDDTSANDLALSLGMATNDGNQGMVERYAPDGTADIANSMRMYTNLVGQCRYNTAKRAGVVCESWSATGFSLRVQNDNINSTILILAESFGGSGFTLANISSDTSPASATDYSLSWNPQFVKLLLSNATATAAYSDSASAGVIGLHTITSDGEYSNTIAGENAQATTDEQSLSDNALNMPSDAGTAVAVGTSALGASKYTITYSTAPATAFSWPALVVREGQAAAPPATSITAEFSASVVDGTVPVTVVFTDLSSAENTTITGWNWDFGDGATSTEQNPTHVYQTAGGYSVSLTADDGAGTEDTETKSAFIRAAAPKKRIIIIGPFIAKNVTETSETITRYDDAVEDGIERGTIEMGLSLNYLPLSGDAEEPDTVTDEVSIYNVGTATKIKQTDGTVKTFTVT